MQPQDHKNTTANEYYTTGIAARELGISDVYVRKLADSGRLPFIRTLGGLRLYPRDAVDRMALERRNTR